MFQSVISKHKIFIGKKSHTVRLSFRGVTHGWNLTLHRTGCSGSTFTFCQNESPERLYSTVDFHKSGYSSTCKRARGAGPFQTGGMLSPSFLRKILVDLLANEARTNRKICGFSVKWLSPKKFFSELVLIRYD